MISPPRKKPPTAKTVAAFEGDATKLQSSTLAPWRVVIDGKSPRLPFGRCASRAGAEAIARKLRAQGLAARVEGAML
jgi:hypothetical protein